MSRNGAGQYEIPVGSWYPPISGTPATAADWQVMIEDLAAAMTQSIARDGQTTILQNLPMGGNKLTGLSAGTAVGDSLRYEQLFSQGKPLALASAATTDIGAQLTTNLSITGTTTITSFGLNYNGPRFLVFAGSLTLTHNATTLILPGGVDIVTAAGDCAIAIPNGTPANGWRVVAYLSSSGSFNANQNRQMSGFRNILINGDFRINQRGYVSGSAVAAANTYTLDRWKVVASGQNVVFSASGSGNQITAPAGGVEQVIEGINIAGGSYVLNWNGTATATVNGTARTKGEIFTLPANTNATVRLIGGSASLVQIEPGTASTPFEYRDIGDEIRRCSRYFQLTVGGIASPITVGNLYAGSISLAVKMRANPTFAVLRNVAINGFSATAPAFSDATNQSVLIKKTAQSAFTEGYFIVELSCSAEL